MPRRKAVRPDFEGRLLLLLQEGPVSWAKVPLELSKAAVELIEGGQIELVTIDRKAHLRLPATETGPREATT